MKIATIGEIHEEGLKLIPKNKFNVIEIIDTSTEKLKEYLYDVDERQWLDFALGSGPLILGHAHPRMVKTIKQTSELGSHHFIPHKRTVELAERICRYVPCAEMVRFTSSGNEATFNALR